MSDKYPGGLVTAAAPAGYSVAVSVNGTYLTATQSAFVATGDFTCEAWYWQNNQTSGFQGIVSTAASGGTTGIRITTDNGTLTIWLNNTSVTVASAPQRQWNHVAISRTGTGSNNVSCYLNGTRVGQFTNTGSTTNSSLTIGRYYYDTANYYMDGYISNVRLVVGSGLYSGSTINVPTQLFPVTNTSLLTCNSLALVDQSSNNFTLTPTGNIAVSTFSPFPSSYYFYNAPINGNTRDMVPANVAGFNPAYGAAAPGVWTLDQAQYFTANRLWPIYDPYFNYTTLMLSGNQPSGVTDTNNNVFKDSSTNNFSITRNGNTTQGTFSPFSQTGWSMYLDGSSTITTPAGLQTAFAGWGGRTRSWESFVFRRDSADYSLQSAYAGVAANGRWFIIINSNKLCFGWTTSTGTQTSVSTTADIPLGWSHLTVCVDSTTAANTTVYLGINGVVQTFTGNDLSTQTSTYGWNAIFSATQFLPTSFAGYCTGLRWSNNLRYTSNYTVPTTAFTNDANTLFLLGQLNRFVDQSTNNYAIAVAAGTPAIQPFSPFAPTAAYSAATVGGSGFFDGTGDYLSVAHNSALSITGNVDASIEFWVYPISGSGVVVNKSGVSGSSYPNYSISVNSNGSISFTLGNSGSPGSAVTTLSTNAGTIQFNAWSHVVCTKTYVGGGSVNNYRVMINGILSNNSTQNNPSDGNPGALTIGFEPSSTDDINAYISQLRIFNTSIPTAYQTSSTTNGTSVYTVPTTPTTASTSSICTLFTNAAIIDATSDNVLETFGNASISTAQSRFGGSSIAFDGSGDRLAVQPYSSNPSLTFVSGDFTVECWVYINSLAANAPIVCFGDDGASTGLLFYVTTAGRIAIFGNNTSLATGTTQTVTTGSWFHLAMSRRGTSLRLFVNGINDGTATNSTSFSSSLLIGAEIFSSSIASQLNGYMNALRITRFARYTANFVPPTSALQLQ